MTPQALLDLAAARRHATEGTGQAIREAANLSRREVADAIRVAESTLWRWEVQHTQPRGLAAIRWAALLRKLSAPTLADRK